MSFDFRESTALFGGSFNPPHLGHTRAIEGILKNPGVLRVIVLPSFGTPLKKVAVSFEERFEMAKLAFDHLPHTKVNDFEFRHQTQFTWQLLQTFGPQTKNPAFVIGTDQFKKLEQWAKFPEVLGLSDWIVLLRKPTTLDSIASEIQSLIEKQVLRPSGNRDEYVVQGKRMKFVETDAPEISSSLIREKIALSQWSEIDAQLDPKVKDFILRNRIYGK